MNLLRSIQTYVTKRPILLYSVVFSVLFGAIKLSQLIYVQYDTTPAVIFPSIGIAFAAVLMGGYRMAIPIFFAHFFAYVTTYPIPSIVTSLLSIAAYTLQPIVGTYVLRFVNFNTALRTTRDAVMLIVAALLLPAIAPLLSSGLQFITNSSIEMIWQNWSRAWAGGVLSIMVVTPLILSWCSSKPPKVIRKSILEKTLAICSVFIPIYMLFWTDVQPANTFVLLYLLFGILFWIGLRMGPRIMTLSLFIIATFSIAGTLLVLPEDTSVNQRLLSIELFVILIAPIFLILASLVEERRVIAVALMENISKLEKALHEISTADTAKSEFIAILAHELRNPLAPIVSSLEWLKLQEQSKESLETIEVAQTQTHTMKRLLDDLLDVARVAQKKIRLQRSYENLKDLLSLPLHSVENLMQGKHHTLVVNVPDESVVLHVDPVRFQQIIVNLLSNAAKYTPNNGHIELRCSIEEDKHLRIEVEDNGIGLSDEDRKQLFNPFRQITKVAQNEGGLGIGLYLTKMLAEKHKGTIMVASKGMGLGTTFTLRLPIANINKIDKTDTKKEIMETPHPTYKILLVDDNLTLANGLRKLLEYKGYEVAVAHSGTQALTMVESFKPKVMLLDIGLPDIDGYEVTKELRERSIPMIIIALTGYGQDKDRDLAREAGFDYHLVKPVGIADIELVLKEATSN